MVNKVVYTLLVIIAITGCKKESVLIMPPPDGPVADFAFSIGAVPQQSTVTFTNQSKNASTYVWDFGDGNTSTETNPVHFYQNGGSYTVKLTAKGPGGSTTAEKTVTVSEPYKQCLLHAIYLDDYDNNFTMWDSDIGADVYITISDGTTSGSTRNTVRYDNLASGTTVGWTLNTPLVLSPLTKTLTVTFWDADNNAAGDPDDLMETITFIPADYTTGANAFPSTWSFYRADVDGRFELSWQ